MEIGLEFTFSPQLKRPLGLTQPPIVVINWLTSRRCCIAPRMGAGGRWVGVYLSTGTHRVNGRVVSVVNDPHFHRGAEKHFNRQFN